MLAHSQERKLIMGESQIGEVPAEKLLGALADLNHKLKSGNISFSELTAFLKRRNPFEKKPKKVREVKSEILPDINWQEVYELLGLGSEFQAFFAENSWERDLDIEFAPHRGNWFVPVIAGVTPNKVVAAFRKKEVAMYLYIADLDKAVTDNMRDPAKGSYVVNFKKSVEAKEHLGKSADDLKEMGIESITLLERLLLGLGYFLATGKHLDNETITLCAGSRNSDGSVPHVHWNPTHRGVCVYWYDVDHRYGFLGTRAVVS